MNKNEKYWLGTAQTHCDLCQRELTTFFVDGATSMGPWATMCRPCFARCGKGLGTGKGQRYEFRENDQKWVNTSEAPRTWLISTATKVRG